MNDEKKSLSELGEKIKSAKKSHQNDSGNRGGGRSASGFNLGLELVSGILVGTFVGISLDKWLDTAPIFFLICIIFGVAAGALNIYKLACKMDIEDEIDENESKDR